MKAAYINPFLEATIRLFRVTFGIDAEAGKPYILNNMSKHRWEISGVMVMTGNAIGVVAIRLTRYLSLKLLEKSGLTCKDEAEQYQLINEMVSELVNVIAGNASGKLEDFNIKVSIPFVIQGENHSVMWPERSPIMAIPFSTPYGPFDVNVSMIQS
ncbi:MAG: chemotaxis protein CheX [Spirochaetales bacterium]|nr:chemotaxis protein CheX [Spirochaetales bacterium]